MDLLGFGDPAHDALLGTFREVMAIEIDDGVSFDLPGLRIEAIREEFEYGGSRLRTTAALAGARIPLTVDIGFGDAVEPGVEDLDLPVLLDMPAPHLRAYPTGDGCRGEALGDGGAGHGQQSGEGLLRHLDAHERIRA